MKKILTLITAILCITQGFVSHAGIPLSSNFNMGSALNLDSRYGPWATLGDLETGAVPVVDGLLAEVSGNPPTVYIYSVATSTWIPIAGGSSNNLAAVLSNGNDAGEQAAVGFSNIMVGTNTGIPLILPSPLPTGVTYTPWAYDVHQFPYPLPTETASPTVILPNLLVVNSYGVEVEQTGPSGIIIATSGELFQSYGGPMASPSPLVSGAIMGFWGVAGYGDTPQLPFGTSSHIFDGNLVFASCPAGPFFSDSDHGTCFQIIGTTAGSPNSQTFLQTFGSGNMSIGVNGRPNDNGVDGVQVQGSLGVDTYSGLSGAPAINVYGSAAINLVGGGGNDPSIQFGNSSNSYQVILDGQQVGPPLSSNVEWHLPQSLPSSTPAFLQTDMSGNWTFTSGTGGPITYGGTPPTVNNSIAVWDGTTGSLLFDAKNALIDGNGNTSIKTSGGSSVPFVVTESATQTTSFIDIAQFFNSAGGPPTAFLKAEIQADGTFNTSTGIKVGLLHGSLSDPMAGQIIVFGNSTLGTDPSLIVIPGSAVQTFGGSGVDTSDIGVSNYYEFLGVGPGPYSSNKFGVVNTFEFTPTGSPITVSGSYDALENIVQIDPNTDTTATGSFFGITGAVDILGSHSFVSQGSIIGNAGLILVDNANAVIDSMFGTYSSVDFVQGEIRQAAGSYIDGVDAESTSPSGAAHDAYGQYINNVTALNGSTNLAVELYLDTGLTGSPAYTIVSANSTKEALFAGPLNVENTILGDELDFYSGITPSHANGSINASQSSDYIEFTTGFQTESVVGSLFALLTPWTVTGVTSPTLMLPSPAPTTMVGTDYFQTGYLQVGKTISLHAKGAAQLGISATEGISVYIGSNEVFGGALSPGSYGLNNPWTLDMDCTVQTVSVTGNLNCCTQLMTQVDSITAGYSINNGSCSVITMDTTIGYQIFMEATPSSAGNTLTTTTAHAESSF